MGKLTIKPNRDITSELIDEISLFNGYNDSYFTVTRDKERYVDNDTNRFIEEIIESHAEEFKEFVAYTDFDLLITTERGKIIRFEENTLGDLVTDGLRYVGKSDCAMFNAGSIRENINKGNITFNHILNTLPFSAKIIVKEIPGKDILDALEFSVRSLPIESSKFLQISGIKFKVDDSFESTVDIDEYENFIKVRGERRVYDVYIGNKKLDENKIYTVTFDDFLGEGGDGYSMFSKYGLFNDTSLEDNEAFKLFLEQGLNRTVPEIYKTTQGRIVKQKKESCYSSITKK